MLLLSDIFMSLFINIIYYQLSLLLSSKTDDLIKNCVEKNNDNKEFIQILISGIKYTHEDYIGILKLSEFYHKGLRS